jgi:DNA-binding NarL/FixJ family response regulator
MVGWNRELRGRNFMTIRTVIADDHEMIRLGIRALLAGSDVEVVAEAESGQAAIECVREFTPDVLILDIRMPNGDGMWTLANLHANHPQCAVLMFSSYDNPTYVARAVAMGAAGYILKTIGREPLLAAIRQAALGRTVWSRDDLRRINGALSTPRIVAEVDMPLTERESQVLVEIAGGRTNKEIAESLNISYETVKEHVQHIFRKIGMSDRTQAALWAVRKGLA